MSILTKKEAFMLHRPEVIDIKYMNCKEYVDKIEGNTKFMKSAKKWFVIVGIIGYIVSVFYAWMILSTEKVHAIDISENNAFLSRFPENNEIIGCYNSISGVARQSDSGKCTEKGDHNIILPARWQIEKWLELFNESEILNRLALVNFESSFKEENGNAHAYGYVQTLRKWGIPPDVTSQLTWMKNRQDSQKVVETSSGSKRCGYYWENENEKDGFEAGEYGVLSCLYRYHYHANKGTWYAKRGIETTQYYKWYMYGYEGKTFEEYKKETE